MLLQIKFVVLNRDKSEGGREGGRKGEQGTDGGKLRCIYSLVNGRQPTT